ncbi:MAG TPA: endonuclease/exonuclease/phosphatase family protein [Gaiellaceae bacterium]|nr:endonuclease/exonuclease/phosphatase family protein [Gaiellaceae bacterium]
MRQMTRVRLAALLLVAAMVLAAWPAAAAGKGRQVTVMTRNLFIGTDLGPVLAAPTLPELVAATTTAFLEVQATRFPERAQAIAGEIAAGRPDVVGLQEAVVIRTDTPADGAATPAETVAYDYLEILLAALAARGLDYEPVAVVVNADGPEVPTALGFDVRPTDRDVILVNRDRRPRLKVADAQAANFAARVTLPTLVGPVSFPRGWTSVDLKLRGKRFRVVNTHLEAFSAAAQVAQAGELLAGPAATPLPTVLLGDFNSRADGTGTPTYGLLRGAGFEDAWSDVHPDDPGLTCCWETHLLSPLPPFDERIDLVLVRGALAPLRAEIVGEDPVADRTPSGLFHSDHAGVVATLRRER